MGTSLLNIGITGLNAAQSGILTTGHNIANASTPGYSRQQISQTTNIPELTAGGYLGQGTAVQTVTRSYNQYLNLQVLGSQTSASEMSSYQAQISQIDNLLADPTAGLSPALAAFFKGVADASANPTSVAGRQSMIAQGQALVSRFQDLDTRLTQIRDGTNAQIGSEVTTINSLAAQIADVNQRIIAAQAASANQPANDLLDQRDQLIAQLNKEIRVSTTTQGDGTYSVFIGNGQPLLVGTQVSKLTAVRDLADPQKTVISFQIPGSGSAILSDALITGGNLGGLVSFRDVSLDSTQNALGRIATGLATAFNQQHKLGQDINGLAGAAFFNVDTPAVFANSGNATAGVPTLSIASVAALTASDYKLSFDGVNYTLLRLSDNTSTVLSTVPQTVDGVSIDTTPLTAAGAQAKDNWLIEPTRYGARNIGIAIADPNTVALAAPISTNAAATNTGDGSIDAGTVTSPGLAIAASTATPPISIVFDTATTYSVYDNSVPGSLATQLGTGFTYTAGSKVLPTALPSVLSFGYDVSISGTPAVGDTFTVSANSNGVSDNRNGLALAKLQTTNLLGASANGVATTGLQSAYSQLVSQVGSKMNEVKVTGDAQQTLADQAQTARDSYSAVNLDEEAANLLKYQQAYQASARMMTTASKLFDTILQI